MHFKLPLQPSKPAIFDLSHLLSVHALPCVHTSTAAVLKRRLSKKRSAQPAEVEEQDQEQEQGEAKGGKRASTPDPKETVRRGGSTLWREGEGRPRQYKARNWTEVGELSNARRTL